jgi:hypothetical protein
VRAHHLRLQLLCGAVLLDRLPPVPTACVEHAGSDAWNLWITGGGRTLPVILR